MKPAAWERCRRTPTRRSSFSFSTASASTVSAYRPFVRRWTTRSRRGTPPPRKPSAASISVKASRSSRWRTRSRACACARRWTGRSTSRPSASSNSVLQRDPAGAYGRMDFLSRDEQRHAVEALAQPQRRSAGARRAQGHRKRPPGRRERLDRRSRRARRLSPHRSRPRRSRSRPRAIAPPLATRARRILARHATFVYLGAIAVVDRAAARGRRCLCAGRRRHARDAGARRAARAAAGERLRDCVHPVRGRPPDRSEAVAAPRFLQGRSRTTPGRWSSSRRC